MKSHYPTSSSNGQLQCSRHIPNCYPLVSQNQCHHFFHIHIHLWCVRLTGMIIKDVYSTTSKTYTKFSDLLTMTSPYWWWILNGKTCFTHKHWIALQICPQDQVLSVTARAHQFIPWPVCDWVTLVPSVECYLYYKCHFLQKKLNSWLTKLQARESYLLNMRHPF
jgi:hypothetical protein